MIDFVASPPENDHPIFFVGRRVRTALGGECQHRRAGVTDDGRMGPPYFGHLEGENGHTGRVVPWPFTDHRPTDGHMVAVEFDQEITVKYFGSLQPMSGAAYAPHELVPLDQDGNEVLHPALERFER